MRDEAGAPRPWNFPSFSEGLSLRAISVPVHPRLRGDFPSFSEGLSLRERATGSVSCGVEFPFLFGGTFIEGDRRVGTDWVPQRISLPFRRDFH